MSATRKLAVESPATAAGPESVAGSKGATHPYHGRDRYPGGEGAATQLLQCRNIRRVQERLGLSGQLSERGPMDFAIFTRPSLLRMRLRILESTAFCNAT